MHMAKSTVTRTHGQYWDVQQNQLQRNRADLDQGLTVLQKILAGCGVPQQCQSPGPGFEVSLDVTRPIPVSYP